MSKLSGLLFIALTILAGSSSLCSEPTFRSHPPLRDLPIASDRPLATGDAYYVDSQRGSDDESGSADRPWRSINHAAARLRAGDTLYLRGGTYYENVTIALAGTAEKPITFRSYPGEVAVLDGGLRDFYDRPAECWVPHPTGVAGEFRSTKPLPNIRNLVGSFGDSQVGLNTYYHLVDLRAPDEFMTKPTAGSDVAPIYCGPGVWYDVATGYLHARFAHTHLFGSDNYRGETDPRKLPLVLAPFRSVPLHLDRAQHVRLQDIVIRGGGFNTVLLDQTSDVEFDNVTIWCGTYGIRAKGARRLRLHRCGLYGNSPPWQTRAEAGLRSYPGRNERDLTRYNTHTLLVAEANEEFDVYSFPFNDDWDIAYCDFCDAGADGLYLGGVNLRFHHNVVDNTTDDGIYLSPMYARPVRMLGPAKLHLYQNYFRRCLTVLAYGGTENPNTDTVYFYRNLVDLRTPVRAGRPATPDGSVAPYFGKLMGDHGGPPWPTMFSYHNTIVAESPALAADMWLLHGATADRPRRMFNNILIHGGKWLKHAPGHEFAHADGNLFWQSELDPKIAAEFFGGYRASKQLEQSKTWYAPGFDSRSLVADPRFVKFEADGKIVNDYRLSKASPAVDAGVELPADWPDPLREQDQGRPDVGALPLGVTPFAVGRNAASIAQ